MEGPFAQDAARTPSRWAEQRARCIVFLLTSALLGMAACATSPTAAPSPSAFIVTLPPLIPTSSPFDEGPEGDHAIGPEDAYLTIMMYCDFQASACADAADALAVLRERFAAEGGVRTVWRHFPQTQVNDKAALALQAAEAAGAQGKFWPMHDLLLARQGEWTAQTPQEFRSALSAYAEQLGLGENAFNAALDDGVYAPLVERARARAAAFELPPGVPVLGFNGVCYNGALDAGALDAMARAVLLEQRWYAQSPSLIIDLDAAYRATIVTEKGDIVVELFVQEAPVAVNNFIFLSQDGWYDGNTFFRVVPGVMAITGDPTNTGLGGPGYNIIDETDNGLTFYDAGTVAMLRRLDRPHSAGSQFFITLGPLAEEYDGRYTIFGRVSAGMETLEALTPRDPFIDPLAPPGDCIEYIIIEKIDEETGGK